MLECLPWLFTLQIEANTCPHCTHTEHCLALMDRQPIDRTAHCAEAYCAAPCDLHACSHLQSMLRWGCLSTAWCASLFSALHVCTRLNCSSVTSACDTIISTHSSQCRYFAVASKECYTPRLMTTVTWVDGQMFQNFHGMVQCYGQILGTAVTFHSNCLHFVASSRTALVTRWYYVTCLYPT